MSCTRRIGKGGLRRYGFSPTRSSTSEGRRKRGGRNRTVTPSDRSERPIREPPPGGARYRGRGFRRVSGICSRDLQIVAVSASRVPVNGQHRPDGGTFPPSG